MNNKKIEQLRKLLHDVKTPITSVLGYSEMLKRSLEKTSNTKETNWAISINEETKKIVELVNEISNEVKSSD